MQARPWQWVVVLACGSAMGIAWGAEPPAPGVQRLEEVLVTAEEEAGPFLEDVAGTRIHAGKKTRLIDLQERPTIVNNNYRQVLAKTPGLTLSEETTPLLSLGYRGLAPHRAQFTQVLKDGVPIHAEMFGYPEAYYAPPLQGVDRIEFVHGGAALMYGPQPGGALNFVTKDPPRETPFAIYSEHSLGSDHLWSHTTSLGGSRDPLGYAGYLHEREGNGFRQANSDFEVIGSSLKVTQGQGSDARWHFTYDEYHEEHGEPGGLTKAVADSQGRDTTTRFNDRFRLERYYGTLAYGRTLSPDDEVEVRGFGGHYRRYSKRQAGGGFGTAATGSTNSIEEQDFYTLGVEPRWRHSYEALGSPDQTLSAGALLYVSDSPREDQTGVSAKADTGTLTRSSERNMQYLSLFAEHLFKFGKLSVTPGVRLEHIWQAVKEHVNTSKALASSREFDFEPLAGVGAAYELGPGVTTYANVSQGYRPKIFTEAVPTGSGQVVNADLEAGRSWQAEVGLRGRGAVNWDASTFFMRFDDQIGTSGNTVENVGDARYQGVELFADADLAGWLVRDAGQRRWSFGPFANLLLLDAKFLEGPQEGKTPQYAPQYTLRSGLQYRHGDRAKAMLSSVFVDDHFAEDANQANRTVPSYKVWDLSGEVTVWPPYVTVFAGVNNLFDERYYARIRSDGIDPAPERNVYGGVRVGKRF
jgi:Fe(3+) dicitrate transport protein